jgi:hypothetical protein
MKEGLEKKEERLNLDDWSIMSLHKPLVQNKDFILVNSTLWQLLQIWFRGGPTIRIPMISAEPDLNLITVIIVDKEIKKGILISLKITDAQLINYLAENFNYITTELSVKFKVDERSQEKELYNDEKVLSYYGIREGSILTLGEKACTDSTIEEEKGFALNDLDDEMLCSVIEASLKDVTPQREPVQAGELRKYNNGHKTPSTGECTPTWRQRIQQRTLITNGYQHLFNIVKQ